MIEWVQSLPWFLGFLMQVVLFFATAFATFIACVLALIVVYFVAGGVFLVIYAAFSFVQGFFDESKIQWKRWRESGKSK